MLEEIFKTNPALLEAPEVQKIMTVEEQAKEIIIALLDYACIDSEGVICNTEFLEERMVILLTNQGKAIQKATDNP